ncbi:MAG: thioredoxin [Candidatus Doudnabacteria bacterium]|nr:thioredoxin [Candidatus Doudnabacteria bacterium]
METKILTDQTFDEEVLNSPVPVLIDFWAPWCGPCKIVSPLVEELALEYEGRVKFGKVNVDDNPQKAMQYQIFSIPSLKIFKKGTLVDEIIGAAPKSQIKKVLDRHL